MFFCPHEDRHHLEGHREQYCWILLWNFSMWNLYIIRGLFGSWFCWDLSGQLVYILSNVWLKKKKIIRAYCSYDTDWMLSRNETWWYGVQSLEISKLHRRRRLFYHARGLPGCNYCYHQPLFVVIGTFIIIIITNQHHDYFATPARNFPESFRCSHLSVGCDHLNKSTLRKP